MTLNVFIGHAITHDFSHDVVVAAAALRSAFLAEGWTVEPPTRATALELKGQLARGRGRELVALNVNHVITSDLLVLLVEDDSGLSSIWVEAGMAMAAGLPTAIVAPAGMAVPFLVTAAFGDTEVQKPGRWRHVEVDLLNNAEEQLTERAASVAADLTFWVLGSGSGAVATA